MQPHFYKSENLRLRAEEVQEYTNMFEAVVLATYLHTVGQYIAHHN
jgi:hypothetical protein